LVTKIAVVGVLLLWMRDEVGVVRPEGWRRYWKKKNKRGMRIVTYMRGVR